MTHQGLRLRTYTHSRLMFAKEKLHMDKFINIYLALYGIMCDNRKQVLAYDVISLCLIDYSLINCGQICVHQIN